jgi:gliding motility-associated protein GldM
MSLPKEPRQLMINLMYLVLTAMLALNVSSEILHAFKTINNSVNKSNDAINGKNNETLLAFQANEQMEGQYDRVHPYNVKAQEIHKEADRVYKYLENWKERIIAEAGGYDTENGEKIIKREDDIDASTRLLVEGKGGDSIKKVLTDLRTYMLQRVADNGEIQKQLPLQIVNPGKTDNNPGGDWSTGNFYNMPTLAAVTLFSKMQNDIRNSESMIMQKLFDEANGKQIKFDDVTAIAVPRTSYALQGQEVSADIMFAAYNKSVNPIIRPSSGQIKVENGVGHWTASANGVGLQTVKGTLSIDLGNRTVSKDWTFQYMVGSTGASMQLDKMNVFYIGVPNPITVSAAGYSLEDVSVSIPGATATKTANGKYDITVTTPGEVLASIIARKQDGGTATVGTQKVRVKLIPDPTAQVGGKSGGPIAANVAKVQTGVAAELKNFDFEARYTVVSFSFMYQKKRDPDMKGPYKATGAYFPGEAKALLEACKAGDRFYIDDIKAIGPDKRVRSLNPLSFVIF